MKKLLNNSLFTFILGGIIFGSISAIAANTYSSNLIVYKGTDGDKPLNEVLDELYPIKSKGDATAANIAEGKTAIVKGQLITGTGQDAKDQYTAGYNAAKAEGSASDGTYSVAVSMILDYNNGGYNPQVRWDPLVTFKINNGVPTVVKFYDDYKSTQIIGKTISADPANMVIKKNRIKIV